jgi:cytoskeleton-associated protein 5
MAEADENVAPETNSLDDVVPSQIKQAFNIAEHAASPVNDLRNKPLAVRINASVPAARKSAYIELASLYEGECAPDASMVAEHAEHIPHMLNDKAPLCHEGALDAALAWMQHAPVEVAASVASAVAKALAEKHTSGKYQAKAIEVLVALLRSGSAGAVQSALAAGIKSKVPKTIAASLKASSQVLAICGGAAFDAQPHIKALPDLLQHRDKSVREEAAGMLGVIRLHHGDSVFKELKAVPEDRLVALKGAPLPESRLDSATGDAGDASADGRELGDGGGVPPIPISRPPFDLLARLARTKGSATPADGWEKSLASDKWAERKKAADTILELLDGETSLKLPADYTVVAKGLKKLYGDANVNVVAAAIKATSLLAHILGKDFGSHAKRVAPALLEKGADKKTAVADAVRAALETLSGSNCLSVVDAAEVALAGVKASSNPALRCTTARWLAAAASSAASEPAMLAKALPALDAALAILDEDSTVEVRSLTLNATASVARSLPSDEAQAWIAGMPPKRGERLSRAVSEGSAESAQNGVAGSDVGAVERSPCDARAATSAPPIELSAPTTSSHTSSRPASARAPPLCKRPAGSEVRASSRPARAASAGGKPSVAAGAAAWLEPELPGADDLSAAVEAADVPPAALRTGMADAAWGARVQALADLAAHVRDLAEEEVTPVFAELLLWQLAALLVKEKNELVRTRRWGHGRPAHTGGDFALAWTTFAHPHARTPPPRHTHAIPTSRR